MTVSYITCLYQQSKQNVTGVVDEDVCMCLLLFVMEIVFYNQVTLDLECRFLSLLVRLENSFLSNFILRTIL